MLKPEKMRPYDKPPPLRGKEVIKPVCVRSVWADNLDYEIKVMQSVMRRYPTISMDTEFPGIVIKPVAEEPYSRNQDRLLHYVNLKNNVDLLNLIQIGLTLSDNEGNLPDLGTGCFYIWEFNFKDFDVSRDSYAPDSIELLRLQGIDFYKNREFGIDSSRFAELMMSSGMVLNDEVCWVTFHCAYDFGYLVKCLTQRALPNELEQFLRLVKIFFGSRVFDVKHLMRYSANLFGGLDRVSKNLGVERVVGKSHQAGSDSLLTLHVFLKIRDVDILNQGLLLQDYANELYGLNVF